MAIIGISNPYYAKYFPFTASATISGSGNEVEVDYTKIFVSYGGQAYVGTHTFTSQDQQGQVWEDENGNEISGGEVPFTATSEDLSDVTVTLNVTSPITYREGGSMGKLTQADISIETADSNDLYANNVVVETDKAFASGTITLGTDELTQAVSKAILGLKEQSIGTIDGVTDVGVKELVYDDTQSAPYLGVGIIVKHKHNGVVKWRAVILTKNSFAVPSDSATTQGESIDWQTPTLEGTIMRDDSASHAWKYEATFTTEAQAVAYIKNKLNIT